MIPVLVLTSAWLAGIFLTGWLNLPVELLYFGIGLGLLLALAGLAFARRKPEYKNYRLTGPVLVALCLGGLRLSLAAPSTGPDSLLYYLGQPDTVLTGIVSAEPLYNSRSGNFRLEAREIRPANGEHPVPVSGEVYVRAAAYYSDEFQRGDLIELTGTLSQPQELTGEDDFSYRSWLKAQGIYTTLDFPRLERLATEQDFVVGRWFYQMNKLAQQIIGQYVPGANEGGLLAGVLLGNKSGLDYQLRQDFATVGLAHIIAVSGSNIAIMILMTNFALGQFFRRRTVVFITLGVIVFYVLLVGASPSVLRAGLMGIMAQVGLLLGAEYTGIIGLATSAFLLTLWQPNVLMDVSFQLSFMATLGLLLLSSAWKTHKRGWLQFLTDIITTTIAAEILILPLVIYYFHQVSLYVLLSNLLVLPVLGIIMAFGGLIVAGGLALSWFSLPVHALGGWCWLFLHYVVLVVEVCANLPFASITIGEFHPVWIFIYYLTLGGLWWWIASGETSRLKQRLWQLAGSGAAVAGSLVLAGGLWALVLARG